MPHFQRDRAGAGPQTPAMSDEQFAELKALLQPGYELSKHMLADYQEAHPEKFAPKHRAPHEVKAIPASDDVIARNDQMAQQAEVDHQREQPFKVNDHTGDMKPPEPVAPAPQPVTPAN